MWQHQAGKHQAGAVTGRARAQVSVLLFSTSVAMVLRDLGFMASFAGAVLGSCIIYIFPALMHIAATKKAVEADKQVLLSPARARACVRARWVLDARSCPACPPCVLAPVSPGQCATGALSCISLSVCVRARDLIRARPGDPASTRVRKRFSR